jgi:hypothetical protein
MTLLTPWQALLGGQSATTRRRMGALHFTMSVGCCESGTASAHCADGMSDACLEVCVAIAAHRQKNDVQVLRSRPTSLYRAAKKERSLGWSSTRKNACGHLNAFALTSTKSMRQSLQYCRSLGERKPVIFAIDAKQT